MKENGIVSIGVDDIHYYDDLVIQLDKNIMEYTDSLDSSIGVNAIMRTDDICRIEFFQSNVHALSNIEYYLGKIKSLDKDAYNRIIGHYESSKLTEFNKEMTRGLPVSYMSMETIANMTRAQDFQMPKATGREGSHD